MRRAAAAALALVMAACGVPSGAERTGCGPDWSEAEVHVTRPGGTDSQPMPIACMHQVANRRIRVGFLLPPGPDCLRLHRVQLSESADAVAITLIGAVSDDPPAGACPSEEVQAITEVDLAAPLDHRTLLDGSAEP
jgi:hypothetical protein